MQGGIADPATVGVSWVPTGAVDLDLFGRRWTMWHPIGWLVRLDGAGGRMRHPMVGLVRWGRRWWTMRHPMVGWFLGQPWWTMHPKIDDARTAQKFAAWGRQKGAPGDSPIFRIIIRLENAPDG